MSLGSAIGSMGRRVARAAARVQAVILLTLLYFLMIGPVSLIARLAGKRMLPDARSESTFTPAEPLDDPDTFGRRQF